MNIENGYITISKDEYYKAYLEQRQRLHVNLVQQLLYKAETKKQLLLNKSAEIINNFIQYRDEFINNMPTELKATKVSDYFEKNNCNIQEILKGNNGDSIAALYKAFQNEFEKVNNNNKKPILTDVTNTKMQSEKKVTLLNKEKNRHLDDSETEDTVIELMNVMKDNNDAFKEIEHTKQSAVKSKVKIEDSAKKGSKKRKWDQVGVSVKENKSPIKGKNQTPKKLLYSGKKSPVPNAVCINGLVSPKKPWMP